jgi:DNA-binding transcriptional regulator of glucitol operon
MSTSFAKRLAAFSVIALSVFAAAPAGGTQQSPVVVRSSAILCQPGFVYRCNKYGCFCVKA